METASILLADPDPALSENLSFFISSDLPRIDLTVCTSTQQITERLSRSKYSTVIASSDLIQDKSSILHHLKRTRHVLVPFILTTGHLFCEPARHALLHLGAFDVIAKPVHPTEALESIRLALWQAQFLRLLTQRERIVFQFECHLAAYPEEMDPGGAMRLISRRVDDMLALVRECITDADLYCLDLLFIDLAVSVQEWTLERALDRIERMRGDRVWA